MVYSDNNNKARYGESLVYQKLAEAGINATWVKLTNKRGVPDFITDDGKMIDVKFSQRRNREGQPSFWTFNLHHHGIKQNNIDFFICVISDSFCPSIFVIPSKLLPNKVFHISERQLIRGKYDYFKENWGLIKESNGDHKDLKKRMKNKVRIENKMEKKTHRQKTDEQYILEGKNPAKRKSLKHRLTGKLSKGRKASDETRAKQSAAKLGKKRPPFTEEHKRRISESNKEFYRDHQGPMKGRRHSEESRIKMSESHKLRYQKNKPPQLIGA